MNSKDWIEMPWDSGLDRQSPAYRIAADDSRYIRVLAGPGTGKSFALKRRVARLLEDGISPTRILPVTFTKVAAEDLQRELINMGVPGCEQIRGSTLHSLGMRILSSRNVLAVTGRVARPLNPLKQNLSSMIYLLVSERSGKGQNVSAPMRPLGRDCSMRIRASLSLRWTRPFRGCLLGGFAFTKVC